MNIFYFIAHLKGPVEIFEDVKLDLIFLEDGIDKNGLLKSTNISKGKSTNFLNRYFLMLHSKFIIFLSPVLQCQWKIFTTQALVLNISIHI